MMLSHGGTPAKKKGCTASKLPLLKRISFVELQLAHRRNNLLRPWRQTLGAAGGTLEGKLFCGVRSEPVKAGRGWKVGAGEQTKYVSGYEKKHGKSSCSIVGKWKCWLVHHLHGCWQDD